MPNQKNKPESGPVQTPELIDLETIAAMLCVSTRHARRMSDSGWMPRPLRLGRCLRWRKAEIDAWISEGCPRGPING